MASAHHQLISECQDICDAFLSVYEKDGFKTLPPSSLLHSSVPMSFVMSAGLIQVENDLEEIIRKTSGKFTFTQPCFRHFDAKQVGTNTTHLSLFHMSAAFHIGSTERDTVLPSLWNFLTETLKLDESRLWVTYMDDPEFGLDQLTLDCWLAIGVNAKHLIGIDQNHCFWQQRATGLIASDGKKCGPHTEVFFEREEYTCNDDCGSDMPASCKCGRFVEISNSLFIENYIPDSGTLVPANTVFAESVIGIERLAMILQGAPDVHRVDRFSEWRKELEPFVSSTPTSEQNHLANVVLDHLSAFEKLVNDGAPEPGRGGRRAIMRKLVRGSVTKILLLDFLIEDIHNLASKILSLHVFEQFSAEHMRYQETLTKAYQILKEQMNAHQTLSQELLLYLEQKHGLSEQYFGQFCLSRKNKSFLYSKCY